MTGTLYIVATPIGNLNDMTPRAIDTLKKVDEIAAEDTRHSATLLKHFEIHTPSSSLHEHNEKETLEQWIQKLKAGLSIAMISDAGTPLISDPGYHLVKQARDAGITVVPIPGPCAAITALSAAGLPSDRFVFEGFLPQKSAARIEQLKTLRNETRTTIFYEAPHRILETLEDFIEVFGENREAVIGREMTKLFETFYRGTLSDIHQALKLHPQACVGEFVVLLSGAATSQELNSSVSLQPSQILEILLKELSLNQAVKIASQLTGEKRNALYDKALELVKPKPHH